MQKLQSWGRDEKLAVGDYKKLSAWLDFKLQYNICTKKEYR